MPTFQPHLLYASSRLARTGVWAGFGSQPTAQTAPGLNLRFGFFGLVSFQFGIPLFGHAPNPLHCYPPNYRPHPKCIWVFFSFWSWNNVTPWFFRAKEFVKHRQHCSIRKQFWLIQLPYLDTTELKCCLIEPDPTCWCPCPSRRGGSRRGCSARTRGRTGDLSGSGALEPWAAKWRSAKRKRLHWEGKQLQGGAKLWKLRGETLKCRN